MNNQVENKYIDQAYYLRLIQLEYEKIPQRLKSFSKEELAIFLNFMYGMVLRMDEKIGKVPDNVKSDSLPDCPEILRIFSALSEYGKFEIADNSLRSEIYKTIKKKKIAGCVYVASFADGNVKIGKSIRPQQRIRDIAAGNQSTLLKNWISDRHDDYGAIEHAVHKRLDRHRVGGEFFSVSFADAIDNVLAEFEQREHNSSRPPKESE